MSRNVIRGISYFAMFILAFGGVFALAFMSRDPSTVRTPLMVIAMAAFLITGLIAGYWLDK